MKTSQMDGDVGQLQAQRSRTMSELSALEGPPPDRLADLLVAYLGGDPAARGRFPVAVHEVLTRLSFHHAWFLPKDVRAEVVNEAHLVLLERGSSFEPERAPTRVFLRLVVRDAVKRVAASYTPPGWRTRPSSGDAKERRSAFLSLEVQAKIGTDFVDAGVEESTYRRCDLRTLFDHAPQTLAYALRRIYYHDEPTAHVAKALGVSRFTLMRQIRSFAGAIQMGHTGGVLAA
jgi:hypothetical protein